MTELVEKLRAVGCDIEGVMARFSDDEETYVECLYIFQADEAFEGLHAALAIRDMHAAFDAAHTLKGVSANLGLTPLNKPIDAITELLRPVKDADGSTVDMAPIEEASKKVDAAKAEFDALLAK